MANTVKIRGWICRSEGYNHIEFYDTKPIRVWGEHINHWTYSEVCMIHILPLEIMPTLEWENEPIEVTLTLSVEPII